MLKNHIFGRSKLLSALGEIALIVIGILLALQIDQWNADRIDRDKEIEYLSFIADGLREDVEELERLITFNNGKADALKALIRLLASGVDGAELHQQLMPLMSILTTYDYFYENRIAFENLKSTDSLSLISDANIQRAITEYYSNERGLIGTTDHLQTWTRSIGVLVAKQMVHDRWLEDFPEVATGVSLPMRPIEEVRFEVTPDLTVNLFYIGILNEAQRREFLIDLEAAQSLLERVTNSYEALIR